MKSTRPYLRTFCSTLLLAALITAPVASAAPAVTAPEAAKPGIWTELLAHIRALLPDSSGNPSAHGNTKGNDLNEVSASSSEGQQGEGGPSIDPLG